MGLSRHLLLSSSPGATSMTCSTALLISGATPEKGAVAGQCVCQCVRASLLLQHNNMGVRKMKLIITTLHTTLGRRGLHGVHNTLGVPDKDQADRRRWRWRWGYPVCVRLTVEDYFPAAVILHPLPLYFCLRLLLYPHLSTLID